MVVLQESRLPLRFDHLRREPYGRTQESLGVKRDNIFLGRMLEPLPKPMSTVMDVPLQELANEAAAADDGRMKLPAHTSAMSARIGVLSAMMASGPESLRRPAIREFQHLAENKPPAMTVAAGVDRAVCTTLRASAEALRRWERLTVPTATEHCHTLRQAYAALLAVAKGDPSAPPAVSFPDRTRSPRLAFCAPMRRRLPTCGSGRQTPTCCPPCVRAWTPSRTMNSTACCAGPPPLRASRPSAKAPLCSTTCAAPPRVELLAGRGSRAGLLLGLPKTLLLCLLATRSPSPLSFHL